MKAIRGTLVLVGLAPDGLRLRLDAGDRVEDGDRAVEHAQRALDLDGEVDVAGRIDDVDAVVLPLAGGRGGGDRDPALLLLLHPVHDGSALVDLAHLVGAAGVVEDALGRRRLTGVDMRHDPDVAGLLEWEVCVPFVHSVVRVAEVIRRRAPFGRRGGGLDRSSAHKKGPKRARALPLNQPDVAYMVRLSMERKSARAEALAQARATRDYSRGSLALPGARMRLKKRSDKPVDEGREAARGARGPRDGSSPLAAGLAEVLEIGREMLAIPAAMALGLAERIGLVVLGGVRFAKPLLLAALALARRGLAVAERPLTPPARSPRSRSPPRSCLRSPSSSTTGRFAPAFPTTPRWSRRPSAAGLGQRRDDRLRPRLPAAGGGDRHRGHRRPGNARSLAAGAGAASSGPRWSSSALRSTAKGLDEGVTAIQFEGAEARLLSGFWVRSSAAS